MDLRQQMIGLIREAVDEIGVDLDAAVREAGTDPAAIPLYSRDGTVSSLELVSLLIALEQAIEERFGVAVDLADDQAMSEARSPFRTVGSLAALACARIPAP